MNELDLYQLIILIALSFMAAFSISLNNFAKDTTKGKQCIPLLYISECLVSGLSGFFLSLIPLVFKQNMITSMLAAGIGGFAGRKLLFVIIKIGILMFSMKKNIDLTKLNDILKTLDSQTNDDNNSRNTS